MARSVKNAVFAFIAIALCGWLLIVVMQTVVPKPEADNATDYEDFPQFVVSHPDLAQPGPHRVRERKAGTSASSGASTPYFIQFADGRYVCGYTDSRGDTKPVFTKSVVSHEIFWDGEAWEHWLRVANSRRER